VYTKSSRSTQTDIWVRAMDGSSPAVAWLATKYDETQPSITSDGRWIAYVSNETGTPEVYLSPYSDTAQVWQISAGGGKTPLWSRDGRELFFVSGSRMMAVRIDTRPEFHAGAPVELFEGGFSNSSRRDFDVTPDGGFVAVGHQGQAGEKKEIRMLLDWPAVMRQMVGAAPGTHH
jgi:Tol biopolymer transport system component